MFMTMKNSSAMQKNSNLTALRGIFILMIVLHHLDLYDGGGSLGVSFFFMLSGFSLSLGYYDKVCKSDFNFCSYFKKRCEKFYPLHWLCLFAVLPLTLLPIIKGTSDIKATIATLIPNALLLQSLIPIKSVYFSFNAVSWYLSATIILAFLYPFIVKGLNKLSDGGKIVILFAILSAYTTLVCLLPIEQRHAILYINPFVRAVDFIIGIYLFLLYRKNFLRSRQIFSNRWYESITIIMIIVAVITSCIASENTVLIAAIYWLPLSILLLTNTSSQQNWGGRRVFNIFVWIGEISFPMYLTHQIVIRYVGTLCSFIGLHNRVVTILISIPLIVIASWLCSKYFLRTVSLWLKERKKSTCTTVQL